MADVNVDYGAVHASASRLDTGHENIMTELSALRANIDELVSVHYKTDMSSGAFHEAYTEFNTGITKVTDGLKGMSAYLHQTVDQFSNTDGALAKAIS
jgi:WXG100 family type VII secretion target